MSDIETDSKALKKESVILSFEPYHFANNLPPATRDKLKEIFANWSDSEKAETMVREIIDETPDTLGVRIVAYRFYFPILLASKAMLCIPYEINN